MGEALRGLWWEHEEPPRPRGTDRRCERHDSDDPVITAARARDAERARAKRAALREAS